MNVNFSRNEPLLSPTKRPDAETRNYPHQQQQQEHSLEIQTLRDDLRDKSARLEATLSEKNQLTRKLKSLEQRDVTDHSKKVINKKSFWKVKPSQGGTGLI